MKCTCGQSQDSSTTGRTFNQISKTWQMAPNIIFFNEDHRRTMQFILPCASNAGELFSIEYVFKETTCPRNKIRL